MLQVAHVSIHVLVFKTNMQGNMVLDLFDKSIFLKFGKYIKCKYINVWIPFSSGLFTGTFLSIPIFYLCISHP